MRESDGAVRRGPETRSIGAPVGQRVHEAHELVAAVRQRPTGAGGRDDEGSAHGLWSLRRLGELPKTIGPGDAVQLEATRHHRLAPLRRISVPSGSASLEDQLRLAAQTFDKVPAQLHAGPRRHVQPGAEVDRHRQRGGLQQESVVPDDGRPLLRGGWMMGSGVAERPPPRGAPNGCSRHPWAVSRSCSPGNTSCGPRRSPVSCRPWA